MNLLCIYLLDGHTAPKPIFPPLGDLRISGMIEKMFSFGVAQVDERYATTLQAIVRSIEARADQSAKITVEQRQEGESAEKFILLRREQNPGMKRPIRFRQRVD